MRRDESHNESAKYPLALLLLVLLVTLGGGAYLMWGTEPGATPRQDSRNDERTGRPKRLKIEYPPAAEAPEPKPQPRPGPEKPPLPEPEDPFTLPAGTRFRRLVLEADSVGALIQLNAAPLRLESAEGRVEVKLLHNTLYALRSKFAVFSRQLLHGKLDPEQAAELARQHRAAFERPAVASNSYRMQQEPRVALWLRKEVKLPRPERKGNDTVPILRRRHEAVSAGAATKWFEAIEAEYGTTDFGRAPRKLPVDIVIFADSERYHKFALRRLRLAIPDWSAGFYSSAWDLICVPANEDVNMAEVVRHEMFHSLQARLAPQSLLVPWFAEGSAEWLDKAPPRGGKYVGHAGFTAAAYGYLHLLVRQGLKLDLAKFLGLSVREFYAEPKLNYLIAYCFVDFVRSEKDLREVYFEFWRLLKEGKSPDEAFELTFGKLDMRRLLKRFLKKIRRVRVATRAPRFIHDVVAEQAGNVPRSLSGMPNAVLGDGEVSPGWYDKLGKLQEAGFDISWMPYFEGKYDTVIVAIENTPGMRARGFDSRQTEAGPEIYDFEAMSRWLFSMRYAGSLSLTRTSEGRKNEEKVPRIVRMLLVDAVLREREQEFTDSTGIKISRSVSRDIKKGYADFDLDANALRAMRHRRLALVTAESVLWYWGTRQDQSDVVLVDFNNVYVVKRAPYSKQVSARFRSNASALQKLFGQTENNVSPDVLSEVDTDWWLALQQILDAGRGAYGSVACLLFTDGPNSAGFFGLRRDRTWDRQAYLKQQRSMAERFAKDWSDAGLGSDGATSVLQVYALPGAEEMGLEYLPEHCPQARVDHWADHFFRQK